MTEFQLTKPRTISWIANVSLGAASQIVARNLDSDRTNTSTYVYLSGFHALSNATFVTFAALTYTACHRQNSYLPFMLNNMLLTGS